MFFMCRTVYYFPPEIGAPCFNTLILKPVDGTHLPDSGIVRVKNSNFFCIYSWLQKMAAFNLMTKWIVGLLQNQSYACSRFP
jgi:hypothetical protein